MEVFNSTHMEWTWHRVIDDEKIEADHVFLVKSGHRSAARAFGVGRSASTYDGYAHLLKSIPAAL